MKAATKSATALFGALAAGAALAQAPAAPEPSSLPATLITNARVFDGTSERLSAPTSVLVQGRLIAGIGVSLAAAPGVVTIDAGGRTLMPGLIDAHWHAMNAAVSLPVAFASTEGTLTLLAAKEAGNTLMRGFTSVRDMAGPVFSLKKAIDSGLVEGPRIWPSGAMISQTSGHGDYRRPSDLPWTATSPLSRPEQLGGAIVADGASEVLKRAREQLMLGATQLKLAAGGGVSSDFDPLDVAQYTEAEFRAAVDAAENWGTYVTVHAYTPRAIQAAIRAGVRCVEHGQLLDEPTARLMADKGVWLSMQPFLDDEDANPFPAKSAQRVKQLLMTQGTDNAYALAKKYKLKTAFGTDTLFDARLATRQGAQLAKMVRWYTPAEVLTMATRTNAELLAMSGPRNPYPGKLGVIEPGALADLLLVDGDPLADLSILSRPESSLVLIMKDGRIHKNLLDGRGQQARPGSGEGLGIGREPERP